MVNDDTVNRFWSKTKPEAGGCVVWTGGQTKGYGHFHVNRKDWYAHRFAYFIEHGALPRGKVVRHTCDNPLCVNPAHLKLGSQKDNIRDMFVRGRNPVIDHRGEKHPGAKLTDEDVRAIRASDKTTQQLACEYGLTYQAIRMVRERITWKHVT